MRSVTNRPGKTGSEHRVCAPVAINRTEQRIYIFLERGPEDEYLANEAELLERVTSLVGVERQRQIQPH